MDGEVTRADGKPIEKPKDFSFFPGSIYKWIRTEQAGLEEHLVEVRNGFAIFKSGRRCGLGALHEMMDPIKAGVDNTAERKAQIANLTAGLEEEPIYAKNPEQLPGLKNKYSDAFEKVEAEKTIAQPGRKAAPQPTKPKVEEKPKSPVRLVLDSNKSTQNLTVKMDVDIEVPHEDIYRVLSTSFPDTNVLDEISDKLLSEMDADGTINKLKDLIKDSLKKRYKVNDGDT